MREANDRARARAQMVMPERTLAIMAKAPRAGRVKTRLGGAYAPDAVVEIYRALVEDTIALGNCVGASIVIVSPAEDHGEVHDWLAARATVVAQEGRGLADGLHSTFQRLCNDTRRVIAFNGDSPHLDPAVLEFAFNALDEHDVVIGPCEDGGYFLVGATQSHPGLFDPVTMGTASALGALREQAERRGLSWVMTSSHYDIDVPSDLSRLERELMASPHRAPRTARAFASHRRPGPDHE